MFDFAWSELALIGVVALVVIGPKDLPKAMRTVGAWTRKARAIAHEFRSSVEQMVRDAELDEVKNTIDKATSIRLDEELHKTIDPTGELNRSLTEPVLTNPLAESAKPAIPELPAPEPAAAHETPPQAPSKPAA